ncbi:MAG: DUF6178 family protein [Syntrophobacterales bacterium]|nr:DUF6178 family protein [Syntrophobacterales bacterium]
MRDYQEDGLDRALTTVDFHHLMTLPAKARMEAILDRIDAAQVVQAMNPQDLYLTVKELGPSDSLPLLSLASTSQWIHLFDMECWQKDQLIASQGIEWLDLLARAGYDPLVKWLQEVDFSFFISLMKKCLRVAVRPDEVDLTEALDYLPPNTIDDQYFWECRYPGYEDLVKYLLSVIFEMNYTFYREVMDYILYTLDAEMEEEAYRFRKGRLEDQAVPDYYDAITIYVPMEPTELSFEKEVVIKEELDLEAPSFALALINSREDLLTKAISEITDAPTLDYIRLELALVANKVLISDQIPLEDRDRVEEAMEKVSATVNLGLHIVSRSVSSMASIVLRKVFVEQLFRVGYSAIRKLHLRAKRLVKHGWISQCPTGIDILEGVWYETLELLLQPFPKLLRERPKMAPLPDFFRTPQDIQTVREHLDTILAMGYLVDMLRVSWGDLERKLWSEGIFQGLQDIGIPQLLFTAIAHILSGHRIPSSLEPISLKAWKDLFPKLHPDSISRCVNTLLDIRFPSTAPTKKNIRRALDRYIGPLLEEYRQEMLPFFYRQEVPDPRFNRFILLSND